MKNSILTIFKKELARFFGDKRMAVTTILLPGLLIFVMYNFMGSALSDQLSVGDDYAPSISVVNSPDSFNALMEEANINFVEDIDNKLNKTKESITDKKLDICLVFPDNFDESVSQYETISGKAAPNIEVYYNSASTDSQTAYETVNGILDAYETAMTNKFDINNTDGKYDLASDKDTTGMIFSSMLPMLLMIFLYSGCIAVAPESIAGEKERGTIATMLITPTKRSHIALGKIFALSIIAVLSGISSALGTILSLPKLMGGSDSINTNVYSVVDYLTLGVVIISTVLVLITVISIISAFAKTIKEAQTYVMPLMIIVMLLGITSMFSGGSKTEMYFYLIPVYNSVQCMSGIFSFDFTTTNIIVTILSNLAVTSAGVYILTKMFNSEKIIFSK